MLWREQVSQPHRQSSASLADARALARSEHGAVAVETAMLLPLFLLVLFGIFQIGNLYFLQNNMLNVARETARRLATSSLQLADASSWAKARLPNAGSSFTVAVTPPTDDIVNDLYKVTITVPLASAVGIDPLGLFRTGQLKAEVLQRAR